jgi:hypothetical protein
MVPISVVKITWGRVETIAEPQYILNWQGWQSYFITTLRIPKWEGASFSDLSLFGGCF